MKFCLLSFKHIILLFITYETVLSTCGKSCPTGWISKFNKCYYLNNERMLWPDASSWCNRNNGTLVQIRNDDEFNFIKELYLLQTSWWALWVNKHV